MMEGFNRILQGSPAYFCAVRIFRICAILFLLPFTVQAQIMLQGHVTDSVTTSPINPVSIENMRTHQGCLSGEQGSFQLEARLGDYIVFTHVGYQRKIYVVKMGDDFQHLLIRMNRKATLLKPLTVKSGPTEYQKDSANRAEIYKDVFDYEQQKSVMTPVTSIYQKFSKKYKNIRKFQEQIVDNEKQKFIDTRYTPELVTQLTQLKDDACATFMHQYPMDYDYARVASDLEIKMWIKYNFQEYQKKAPADTPIPAGGGE